MNSKKPILLLSLLLITNAITPAQLDINNLAKRIVLGGAICGTAGIILKHGYMYTYSKDEGKADRMGTNVSNETCLHGMSLFALYNGDIWPYFNGKNAKEYANTKIIKIAQTLVSGALCGIGCFTLLAYIANSTNKAHHLPLINRFVIKT